MENESVMSNLTEGAVNELSNKEIAIGSVYIVWPFFIILLHSICSYLMYADKEMKSPTYALMINLAMADCVELAMLGPYSAIVIFTKRQHPVVSRVASFLCLSAWYATCALFAIIAFSRWIAITRPHLEPRVLSTKILWSLHLIAWLIMGIPCFYGNLIYQPGPIFPFYPSFYTWDFDETQNLGKAFTVINMVFNWTCTFFEMSFNISSLIHVRKSINQIQMVDTHGLRTAEIKLLLQSFILGVIFTFAHMFFTVVFAVGVFTPTITLCVHSIWLVNHSVNPFVYLAINTRLRESFCAIFKRH